MKPFSKQSKTNWARHGQEGAGANKKLILQRVCPQRETHDPFCRCDCRRGVFDALLPPLAVRWAVVGLCYLGANNPRLSNSFLCLTPFTVPGRASSASHVFNPSSQVMCTTDAREAVIATTLHIIEVGQRLCV